MSKFSLPGIKIGGVVTIVVAAGLLILGGGCDNGTQTSGSPPPSGRIDSVRPECPNYTGAPTDADLRCLVLQASFDGKLPKRITDAEADLLVSKFRDIRQIMRDWEASKIGQDAATARMQEIDASCTPIAGKTCAELFLSPL